MGNDIPKHQGDGEVSLDRRNLAALVVASIGAMGLAGCADAARAGDGRPESAAQPLASPATGGLFLWADTIADLRTLIGSDTAPALSAKPVAVVGGYYAPGDGGGGVFYWDNTSSTGDDGGIIIVPTGSTTGRWVRQYSDSINVKWFGVRGNGVANDRAALQNAIDAAVAAEGPTIGQFAATIALPSGDYLLDGPVNITTRVRIIGHNARIRLSQANQTAFIVATSGVRFDTIWFEGWANGSDITEQGGIGLDVRASRCVIDDCMFHHFRIGAFVRSNNEDGSAIPGANGNLAVVRDCQFVWCINGLWMKGEDAQAGSISGCYFNNCRRGLVEDSFLGNLYLGNTFDACPSPADPNPANGYSIEVTPAQQSNYSTFVGTYLENDSPPRLGMHYCLVVGGNFAAHEVTCEKVGYQRSKLVFRGGPENPDDLFVLGGTQGIGGVGWFQRGGNQSTYATLKWTGTEWKNVPYPG